MEIALRQLGLLQRALQNSPPEITSTLKEMLTGDVNSFRAIWGRQACVAVLEVPS